jgi:hypothetical protein
LFCSKSSCDEDIEQNNESPEYKPILLKSPKRDKTYESKDSRSKSVSLMPSDMLCVRKNMR